ncbi:MAG: hypothetical protein KAW67_07755 [Candidatus Eisenbacteria sp.]|nr:hypothetical protein [Candidatus Eisenbacteria bacterium]
MSGTRDVPGRSTSFTPARGSSAASGVISRPPACVPTDEPTARSTIRVTAKTIRDVTPDLPPAGYLFAVADSGNGTPSRDRAPSMNSQQKVLVADLQ